MRVKVSEATDLQLDWMVAKCEDKLGECTQAKNFVELCKERKGVAFTHGRVYSPSTNWSQGGPIIEREGIDLYRHIPTGKQGAVYSEYTRAGWHRQFGETKLVAAMRCYIVSKLGEEMEIPNELT